MSAFSDADFKASNYSDFRPTYNKAFFDLIFSKYHPKENAVALDIGCGTGQVTNELALHFGKVIGTDLSATMIQTAKDGNKNSNVEYVASSAENLSFIKDGSIDMVTCGQLCHWFDHTAWFEEMFRILNPHGLLIYFGYADPVLVSESLECNELLDTIEYGDAWLGKYWEQPGRQILRDMLVKVDEKIPKDKFEVVDIAKFDGVGINNTSLNIERDMNFSSFINYVGTWSSLHNYHKLNPQIVGTEKDIYEQFYHQFHNKFGWNLNKELKVVWKTFYTVARKI